MLVHERLGRLMSIVARHPPPTTTKSLVHTLFLLALFLLPYDLSVLLLRLLRDLRLRFVVFCVPSLLGTDGHSFIFLLVNSIVFFESFELMIFGL